MCTITDFSDLITNLPRPGLSVFVTRLRTMGLPHVMLLGRTTLLIATRWYVGKHVGIACRFIYVQAGLNCVTPYSLLWLCIDFWSMRITKELWDGSVAVDKDRVR